MRRHIKEAILITRKMTFRKIWNIFLLRFSFYLARVVRKPVIFGNPMALSIEPTTACNLRCPECPSGLRSFTRPVGSLDLVSYRKIIESQQKHLCYLNLYFQGEPFLNNQFFRMVSIAHVLGIFVVSSTNGHFLDDERAKEAVLSGLDKLIISVDGTDQETYAMYRSGGDLEKVLAGIGNIIRWKKILKKKTPQVVLQFIIFRWNQHQVNEMKRITRQTGVDALVFKTAQIYDYEKKDHMIPDNPAWSRYHIRPDGSYAVNGHQSDHCWRMWSSSVITWDGRVLPCCFDKDAGHQLGQLGNMNFNMIWKGDRYKAFREKILHSRNGIDICTNCTEGTKVWA